MYSNRKNYYFLYELKGHDQRNTSEEKEKNKKRPEIKSLNPTKEPTQTG
jgi:hypothetical protein